MQTGIIERNATDINQVDGEPLIEKPFPSAASFRVLVSTDAHETMWAHARGTLADGDEIKEVGGILVGRLFRDENGPYLHVDGAIVAEHTRNEGTEVAFTPDTWARVNQLKDARFPAHLIVGWYHTHPNFGIFLSERDQFVHRHSFPQPWGVAYVIDPVQSSEGLFVWKAGEPREAPEYWVGTEHRLARANSVPAAVTVAPVALAPPPSLASWLVAVCLALVAIMTVVVYAYSRELLRSERDAVILRALESERVELDRAFQILQTLSGEVERVSKQSTTDIAGVKGQAVQLESGLRKLNDITRTMQRRVQGLEDAQTPDGEQR